MSYWRARAREEIAKAVAHLHADATLEQREKALRGKGFSGGWAQKAWIKERRAYLEQHGLPPRRANSKHFDFPDHVHFPFRGEADAQG